MGMISTALQRAADPALDVRVHLHSSGMRFTVRYGERALAQFWRKDLAVAYLDWFTQRRDAYLRDTRLGRFTLQDLISARLPRR